MVGATGAGIDAEQEFIEPGQHEGGGGGGAGRVQEARLAQQGSLEDLQGRIEDSFFTEIGKRFNTVEIELDFPSVSIAK